MKKVVVKAQVKKVKAIVKRVTHVKTVQVKAVKLVTVVKKQVANIKKRRVIKKKFVARRKVCYSDLVGAAYMSVLARIRYDWRPKIKRVKKGYLRVWHKAELKAK